MDLTNLTKHLRMLWPFNLVYAITGSDKTMLRTYVPGAAEILFELPPSNEVYALIRKYYYRQSNKIIADEMSLTEQEVQKLIINGLDMLNDNQFLDKVLSIPVSDVDKEVDRVLNKYNIDTEREKYLFDTKINPSLTLLTDVPRKDKRRTTIRNILIRNDYNTIADVALATGKDIGDIHGVGPLLLTEVRLMLKEYNVSLIDDYSGYKMTVIECERQGDVNDFSAFMKRAFTSKGFAVSRGEKLNSSNIKRDDIIVKNHNMHQAYIFTKSPDYGFIRSNKDWDTIKSEMFFRNDSWVEG